MSNITEKMKEEYAKLAEIIDDSQQEDERHRDAKKKIVERYNSIRQEHPGFSNEDVGI